MIVPFILIGLAVAVIAVDDASFLGGVRPFDGGDDGLFYDGVGRVILQKLLGGDICGLSARRRKRLLLRRPRPALFPRARARRVRRELSRLSLAGAAAAVSRLRPVAPVPAGTLAAGAGDSSSSPSRSARLFGTTFFQYAQWAARGFADPAAYILFVAGLAAAGARAPTNPSGIFCRAFFGALLFALAIFMKPIVAPAAAVLLGGAGICGAVRGGSGRGLPACASVSCRCFPWPCTTGCSAMSSCCSAPMPAIRQVAGDAAVGLCAAPHLHDGAAGRPRRAANRALAERPGAIAATIPVNAGARRHPHLCRCQRGRPSSILGCG